MSELNKTYTPSEVEDKWYAYWLENKLFSSKPSTKEPFTIVIPPPNVTGVLHMGHMLNNTIQDVLVRRARMQGKEACWVRRRVDRTNMRHRCPLCSEPRGMRHVFSRA